MTLIIDSREPKWLAEKLLKAVPDARLDTFNYGDFVVIGPKQKFVIERKTVTDLFSSMIDGRLWDQAKGLEKYTDYKRMILLEGSFRQAQEWNPSYTMPRFTAAKVALMYGWDGISIVAVENQDETVDFLRRLDAKVGVGAENDISRPLGITKNARTPNEELVDVLRGFDGVGEVKAAELLTKFRTIGHIARASLGEISSVLGENDVSKHVWDSFRRKFTVAKKKEANGEVKQ